MAKQKLTDEELLDLIHKGNEDAYFILIERYRPYAWKIAHEYAFSNCNSGITVEEFMDVAFTSIDFAVKKFDQNGEVFFPYWKKTAKNEILKFIERNSYINGGKEFNGLSLDGKFENDVLVSDIVGKDDSSFDEKTVNDEFFKLIHNKESGLNKQEIRVAHYLLKGYSVKEISRLTGYGQSKVYYLVNSVKKTLYDIIINRYFK